MRTYYVRMANPTLSILDDLLKRGRRYARARGMGTSLNALVRELLDEVVSSPDSSVSPLQARQHLRVFRIFDIVQVTPAIIEEGIDCSILHQLSFWDGLIVAAAVTAASSKLLSEDLNIGQSFQGIAVRNPFR